MADSAIRPPYSTEIQPPPGSVVSPDGFPANPYPKDAPQVFKDAMSIRIKIFCDEQKCRVEEEIDPDDAQSWSWVVYETKAAGDDGKAVRTPVSTIRIVPPPHGAVHPNGFEDPDEEPYLKLTRVATLGSARGKGLSKHLIEEAFAYLAKRPELVGHGWKGMVLTHAQVYIEKMYQKMGFTTDERLGRWDEEGIAHLGMWRRLPVNDES